MGKIIFVESFNRFIVTMFNLLNVLFARMNDSRYKWAVLFLQINIDGKEFYPFIHSNQQIHA